MGSDTPCLDMQFAGIYSTHSVPICPSFKVEWCHWGDVCSCRFRCPYAHDTLDQRDAYEPIDLYKYPFFKTTMCKRGVRCPFGDECRFAHNVEELRDVNKTLPAAMDMFVKDSDFIFMAITSEESTFNKGLEQLMEMEAPIKRQLFLMVLQVAPFPWFKTNRCRASYCFYGDRCRHAHSDVELRKHDASIVNIDPKLYPLFKTEMCTSNHTNYEDGKFCQFAHTVHELRIVDAPESMLSIGDRTPDWVYKTHLCKRFVKLGVCKFGLTCGFAHGKHELKTAMCRDFPNCKYGDKCNFVHGLHNHQRSSHLE